MPLGIESKSMPSLGPKPIRIHELDRSLELIEAIRARISPGHLCYSRSQMLVPIEWTSELLQLIDNHNRYCNETNVGVINDTKP